MWECDDITYAMIKPKSVYAPLLKLYNSYLESLVPLFDGGLVVWRMRLQEVHIFFGEFIFTHEATHLGKLEQKEKTLIRLGRYKL